MTPEEKKLVEQMRAALTEATPRPWKVQDGGGQLSSMPAHITTEVDGRADWFIADLQDDLGPAGGDPNANAVLIVQAVNNLPTLIAALEAAVERVGELEGRLSSATMFWSADNPERPYDSVEELVYDEIYDFSGQVEGCVDTQEAAFLPGRIYKYHVNEDQREVVVKRLSPDQTAGVMAARKIAEFARKALETKL